MMQQLASEQEINARFSALETQRNDALNRFVLLYGEHAVLQAKFDQLQKDFLAMKETLAKEE